MESLERDALVNLPRPPTPLVGRETELAEIAQLLSDPACRLLTLVGPGGIGKTRLAIEVAVAAAHRFADGVFFVSLQPVQSTDHLIAALAGALKLPLSGQVTPRRQALDYLSDKTLLLLFDNFEQLLNEEFRESDATGFMAELHSAAPEVKLLVTSRESLNLQGEWLFPVAGLSNPRDAGSDELASHAAIQLFVACARRVRHSFSLKVEAGDVARICRLVDGNPLALELAAAWTKTLRCNVIADQIQTNLDFLASRARDAPVRHRSMRAVFDQAWQRLTDQEREVFKRLSVFRGGFRREAAERVAGASLVALTSLVEKSLLRWELDGRCQLHELLRQYAGEKLDASPDESSMAHDAHCAYFAGFLLAHRRDMQGGRQREATLDIAADIDNVRAAWRWAIDHTRLEDIGNCADTLHMFFQYQSRYLECAEAFDQAVQLLERTAPRPEHRGLVGQVLLYRAWQCVRLGQLQQAKALIEKSLAIFEQLGRWHPPFFACNPLIAAGTLANIFGDYAQAEQLGEEARRIDEANGDGINLVDAHYVLANAAFSQGRLDLAQEHAQRALTLAETLGDRWMMAYVLSDLGSIACAAHEYATARRHFQASFASREALDDPEGMAAALNHLGEVACLQHEYAEAERFYRRSLALYEKIADRGGLAQSLKGLGDVACATGDTQMARQHYGRALDISAQMQFTPLTLSVLTGVGELLLRTGRIKPAIELLACTRAHPANYAEGKARAQRSMDAQKPDFDASQWDEAVRRGESLNLDAAVTMAQIELTALAEVTERARGHHDEAALIEPLTPREADVLGLIAAGLSNQDIADRLIVSIGTVKTYTHHIYGKLGVSSRTQAILRARALGLVPKT
jgi:predicted ATPase/DNA-binding NarL/FixJ family response regulator/Tfp pilus assembly protein PilF